MEYIGVSIFEDDRYVVREESEDLDGDYKLHYYRKVSGLIDMSPIEEPSEWRDLCHRICNVLSRDGASIILPPDEDWA